MTCDSEVGFPKSGATDGAAGDDDHFVQMFAARY